MFLFFLTVHVYLPHSCRVIFYSLQLPLLRVLTDRQADMQCWENTPLLLSTELYSFLLLFFTSVRITKEAGVLLTSLTTSNLLSALFCNRTAVTWESPSRLISKQACCFIICGSGHRTGDMKDWEEGKEGKLWSGCKVKK